MVLPYAGIRHLGWKTRILSKVDILSKQGSVLLRSKTFIVPDEKKGVQ